jgi:MerR family transcriptional regulator, light-induced transcriptional regulator
MAASTRFQPAQQPCFVLVKLTLSTYIRVDNSSYQVIVQDIASMPHRQVAPDQPETGLRSGAAPNASAPALTIAAVERDTRIGKDTLRVWERRYGFPQPHRDSNGERLYPAEQVERLRHVKRLLDAGHRPGRIVGMDLEALQGLSDRAPAAIGSGSLEREHAELQRLMAMLASHDLTGLRRALSQSLLRLGLERFVIELAIPLVGEVGQSWSRGQMAIYEEHLFSEALETVLRSAMAAMPEPDPSASPRVVLSTFPFEAHGLGLLMADALFQVSGCATMNLGRQTPLHDLALACQAHQADIIALSFSAATNPNQAADGLTQLRARLPVSIEIWSGSPLSALHRRQIEGVNHMTALEAIGPAVERWRAGRD